MSLFRPEVLAERARSHWGSVLVTQAPALRWASIGLLLACGIGGVLVLGLDYARKVRLAGYIEPRGGIAEVAAPVAGRVAALHVREGSRVTRGQALMVLDLGNLDEHGVSVHALEADHLAASIRRLDELAQAQAARYQTELRGARQALIHLDEEQRGLRDELAVIEERQTLLVRAEARVERLLRQGLVARSEYERQRQQTLAIGQSASQLARALAENAAQNDLRQTALARLARDYRIQELQVQQDRAALQRRLQRAREQRRTTVVAPRDGVAAFLQFGPGDRVTPEQVLMTVAPETPAFELVLLADTAAAGRIAVGNEVRFRALGNQRDGKTVGAAVVREISHTPQKPYRLISWVAVDGPVFRARAEVLEYPENLRLRHGIRVDAFVVSSSKSLWLWLVEPLSTALESL